jgi:hypothetical protein
MSGPYQCSNGKGRGPTDSRSKPSHRLRWCQ